MNENPEGTPNPLNPNPEMGVAPDLAPEPNQMDELAPEPEPIVVTEVAEEVTITTPVAQEEVVAASVAPEEITAAPVAPEEMAAASVMTEEPNGSIVEKKADNKKSKKTAWIVVAVVAFLVAVGCAVAALLILNPFKSEDRVSLAITKLLDNQIPGNVAANGTLTLVSDAEDSDVAVLKVEFDAEFAMAHGTNNVAATVSVEMADGTAISADVEETMVADGDLYLRVDGLMESFKGLVYEQLDCEPDVDCPEIDFTEIDFSTMGEYGALVGVIQSIEGEWVRVPAEMMTEMDGSMIDLDEDTQCLIDAISGTNDTELVNAYKANPFVTSTTENITIAAKKDTIYRLGVDEAKLNSFADAIKNTEFSKKLAECAGGDSADFSAEALGEIFSRTPAVYVEIDENNNFTRLSFSGDLADGENAILLDTSFSYPSTIEVVEPAEYTDINTLLMTIFSGFSVESL